MQQSDSQIRYIQSVSSPIGKSSENLGATSSVERRYNPDERRIIRFQRIDTPTDIYLYQYYEDIWSKTSILIWNFIKYHINNHLFGGIIDFSTRVKDFK